MNGFQGSDVRLSLTISQLGCLLMLGSLLVGEVARVEAAPRTAIAGGDWATGGPWNPAIAPVAGDDVQIGSLPSTVGNFSFTVGSNSAFGSGSIASTWVQSGANEISVNSGVTLTHVAGSTFNAAPFNNYWLLRGAGTFINDGTFNMLPRNNSWDTGRFRDAFTFVNNGVLEFQGVSGAGPVRSNSLLVEANGMHLNINSVGTNPGVVRVNMGAPGTGLVATLGYRQNEILNRLTYTGDVGETPFQIVSGNLIFGLPGRGTLPTGVDANFKYNGQNFNGNSATLGSAPLHTAFDRTVFDDLFGDATTAIPTGSLVGVSGAFDTIDLISANSGTTATNRQHNFNGRIGIASSGWQTQGNMMPTSDGGTLTITAQTDADWYNGGFNTRGGTISNFGALTARLGLTLGSDDIAAGTGTGVMYIGRDVGTSGQFRNEVGGLIRFEEGQLQVRDANNFLRNFGTFELAGSNANLYVGVSGVFSQEVGGTINFDPGAGNFALVTGDQTLGGFNNNSGVPMTVASGTLRFSPGIFQVNGATQSTITAATINSAFNVAAGQALEFGTGSADFYDVDVSLLPSNVTHTLNSGASALSSTGTAVFTEQNEVNWRGGHMSLQNGSIVNNGIINKIGFNGAQINSSNLTRRTFTNNGQLNLLTGSAEIHLYQATTLDNFGEINLLGNGSQNLRPVNGGFAADTEGVRIHNQAGGIIRVQTDLDTQQNSINFQNAPSFENHVLRNEGTFEVTRGIFRVFETVGQDYGDFLSATSTELTEGTYRVISSGFGATTDMARLDLNIIDGISTYPVDSYSGPLTSIAAAAKVVLSSDAPLTTTSGAQFPQLGTINNLEGSLYVHNAVNLQLSPTLNVESGASLGGNGAFNMQGGALTFDSGGTLDPSALDGGIGTLNILGDLVLNSGALLDFDSTGPGLSDKVVVSGDLTLAGTINLDSFGVGSYTLFEYDPNGTLTDNGIIGLNPLIHSLDLSIDGFVILNVVPIPEPSSMMLLGLGALFVLRVSRRRVPLACQ